MDQATLGARLADRSPIQGSHFTTIEWRDIAADDAAFTDCVFADAVFTGTRFNGASFTRCRFQRCRFTHASLVEAVFTDCGFAMREPEATGCSCAFSDLRQSRFTACDLSFCVFDRSDLFAIELDRCNLLGARFQKADFSHAYSRKIVTTRAIFRTCNLELADLAEARLPDCDLSGCRLREADLSAADLTGAVLRECDLFQTVLTGAKLEGADLRGAEISGLNLLSLGSFRRMKVDPGHMHSLLAALDVDVDVQPDRND